jgi:hypothetical protein
MKHRDHLDAVGMRSIKDAIRKSANGAFADVGEHAGMEVRFASDSIERALDLRREFWPESDALPIVEVERFVELRGRLGAEDDR